MNYEIHKCVYYIVKKKVKYFHEGGCYISLSEEKKKKKNNESNLGPAPVLLPGKSHGRRSLVGCSP